MCIQHGPAGPSIRKTKICIQTTRENRNSIQWRNREKVNMKKNVRLKCFYLLNRLNIVRFFNVIRFAAMRRLILRQQRCICKRNRQKREEVVTIMKKKTEIGHTIWCQTWIVCAILHGDHYLPLGWLFAAFVRSSFVCQRTKITMKHTSTSSIVTS